MNWIRLAAVVCGSVLLSTVVLTLGAPKSEAAGLIRISATKPHVGGNVALNAEIFRPKGKGQFPAVVMMHGCGGWQPAVRHSIRQHAKFLMEKGYVVLSLDSFGPRGKAGGTVCKSFGSLREAREYRTYDAFDALAFLQKQSFVDSDRIFLVGQSNGGSVALKVAERGAANRYGSGSGFRGVVALYPWCGALNTSRPVLGSPLLILGGGRDDWVPPDECTQFRSSGAPLRVKVYPSAPHSFDVIAPVHRYLGKLVGYDRAATEDSRRLMLGFFANTRSNPKTLSVRQVDDKASITTVPVTITFENENRLMTR